MTLRFKVGDHVIANAKTTWVGKTGVVIEIKSRYYAPYIVELNGRHGVVMFDDDTLDPYIESPSHADHALNWLDSNITAEINAPSLPEPITIIKPMPYHSLEIGGIDWTNLPRSSGWKCTFLGNVKTGMSYTPVEGAQPNAFHRFMQRLILGHIWTKIHD